MPAGMAIIKPKSFQKILKITRFVCRFSWDDCSKLIDLTLCLLQPEWNVLQIEETE
jgi:hypothetical protein